MELQRNFNLMRELDGQSHLLVRSIEERMQTIFQPESASSSVRQALLTASGLDRLRQDCRKALEQADEKVSVATHAHEMVERYLRNLDEDLLRYEDTLQTKLDVDAMKASRRRRRAEEQEAKKARRVKAEDEAAGRTLGAMMATEETYCLCKRVSFGTMVACDDPHCKTEWYHLACVGLTAVPAGSWICADCVERRRKKKKKK